MKLTKQKLEQLITEEYVRRIGDEGKPTNRPEFQDKLTTLAKSDPKQAASLADSLDEPLDIEFNPKNMKTMQIQDPYIAKKDHDLHFDFLLWGDGSFSFVEEPDIGEVYQFSQELGLDPQETYNKIMRSYRKSMLLHVNQKTTEHDRNKELEDLYGFDLRPDWMKRNHYD